MQQKLFSKNFSLLILGQISSLFGNYILKFALSMYILEQTGSATIFAGILAIATIPMIILSPLGGILADRANRKNIMVTLDFLSGITVLIAAVFITSENSLVIITAILIILSVLGAFETPTVQACVPQMQEGENIIQGNAVVNQVSAIAGLTAPFLGSMLYMAIGLRPVMFASIACFFITALLECFIKLEYIPFDHDQSIFSIVKNDFISSMHFIGRKETSILKTLLLITLITFFIQSVAVVGLPYIIRTILGLSANYYGAAESVLGFAALVGSILAGLITGKLKVRKLYVALFAIGILILPMGIIFLVPAAVFTKYIVIIITFSFIQIAACIFSVFAVSVIQQLTPNDMIGKVMAYTVTITLCLQPLGQIIYGVLFDRYSNAVYLVLIPTGIIICLIGLGTKGLFRKLDDRLSVS